MKVVIDRTFVCIAVVLYLLIYGSYLCVTVKTKLAVALFATNRSLTCIWIDIYYKCKVRHICKCAVVRLTNMYMIYKAWQLWP